MMMSSMFEFLILMLLGVFSLPVPVGIPPLPEDPALLRAAPADAVAFVEWFGNGLANPQSANATERLAAEPQVRAMVRRIADQIGAMIEAGARQDGPVARDLWQLGLAIAQRPGCVFVAGVGKDPTALRGGLVVNLGAEVARTERVLASIDEMLAEQFGGRPARRDVGGAELRVFATAGPEIVWGIAKGYLIVAVGAGTGEGVVRGLESGTGLGGAPVFAAVHGNVRVAQPCLRAFVDLAALVRFAEDTAGPDAAPVLDALGVGDLRAYISESGLEGNGYAMRGLLSTGGRSGLLKLFGKRPLSDADLAPIPADSTVAGALRVHPHAVYRQVLDIVRVVEPDAVDEWRQEALAPIEAILGVRVEEDLIANLGDTLTWWSSPGQGGLLVTGLTACISLANPKSFRASFATAMQNLREAVPKKERGANGRVRRGGYLAEKQHGEHTIFFLETVGEEFPIAPAICATDTHLLIGLFPQTLEDSIDHLAAGGPSIAKRLADRGGAVAVAAVDAPRALATLYPVIQVAGQVLLSELAREGFDADISVLPRFGALRPHLGDEVQTVQWTDDGLALQRTGTLPWADPFVGAALPVLGFAPLLWFRYRAAGMQVRAAERRDEEIKRQILERMNQEPKREEAEKRKK